MIPYPNHPPREGFKSHEEYIKSFSKWSNGFDKYLKEEEKILKYKAVSIILCIIGLFMFGLLAIY